MKLDEKGRCCGRKPIHYKGGSWSSPLGSPMLFCCKCYRDYDVKTGEQRPNWAWTETVHGVFERAVPSFGLPSIEDGD